MNIQQIENHSLDSLRDYLLNNLERKVGDRDKLWVLHSTVLFDDVEPHIFYPARGLPFIRVNLTISTERYPQQRFFQMSHEVVHLLNPSGGLNATNLEEGFASFNSVVECSDLIPRYVCDISKKYERPYSLLQRIGDDNRVYDFIKKVRSSGFTMQNVTKIFVKKISGSVWNDEEIDFLLSKFSS